MLSQSKYNVKQGKVLAKLQQNRAKRHAYSCASAVLTAILILFVGSRHENYEHRAVSADAVVGFPAPTLN
jgi:hypothetical protein